MRRAVFWVLGLATVGGGLAAVNARHDSGPVVDWQLFRPSPPRVVVARPTRGSIARVVAAKGIVEPVRQSGVVARVAGRVAEVLVAEGDAVRADQPLIRLDEAQFRRRLDAAQSRLDAATKNLATAEAHLKDIEKDPAAATTPATPAPAPTPAAAAVAVPAAAAGVNPALANLAALRGSAAVASAGSGSPPVPAPAGPSKLAAARESVDGWERERKAAEPARDAARADLDRATIRAPFAGVVEDLDIAVGDDVTPRPAAPLSSRLDGPPGSAGPLGMMGASGGGAGPDLGLTPDRPLCVILDPGQLRVRAWIDEADVGLVATGQPARVFLPDGPTEAVAGRVGRVAPRGRPSGEVVAFAATVSFDDASHRARAGMRTNVEVEVARRDGALGVPVQAVVRRRRRDLAGSGSTGDRDGYVKAVFVLDGDRARLRPITTGLSDERRVEVAGGLAEEDQVIVGPFRSLDALDDGTVVAVEADGASPAAVLARPTAESTPPNGFGPPR